MRRGLAVSLAVLAVAGVASAQEPEKLVPPPPPPWDETLSTSGTDLVAPKEEPAPRAGTPHDHMMHEHMAKMRELERRIAELEHERREEPTPWVKWLQPSLLLQPQLVWNFYNAAASPNASGGVLPPGIGSNDVTATPGGGTTNRDELRLRRARLKLDFQPSEFARFVLEFEPMPRDPTIPGSGTIARQIEAIARLPLSHRFGFEVGAGSFEVPFGGEWLEAHGDRPFIERSWFQQNLFPGDFDLGLHGDMYASDKLRLRLALLNGRTFGELDQGGGLDLNRPKDGALNMHFKFGGFEFGQSAYVGEGQLVDSVNLRFKQYLRFAYDADVEVRHDIGRLGTFAAMGELFIGQNMDRGVLDAGNLPVMPVDLTQDVQNRGELGALVRLQQDLGRFFLVAARWDYYDADLTLSNDARHTLAAVVAIRPFQPARSYYGTHPSIQFDLEYDHAWDTIRASGPAGATKEIDTLSFVLQGRL